MTERTSVNSLSEAVAQRFAASAAAYEQEAIPQRESAAHFAGLLRQWEVLDGPLLEIGCGIGFVTEHLVPTELPLDATDLSPEVLVRCAERCGQRSGLNYWTLDGQAVPADRRWRTIVSAWTFQWFEDLEGCLKRLRSNLEPGGSLCLSLPTSECFPRWREACARSGVRYTGHPLPTAAQLAAPASDFELRYHTIPTNGPSAFFAHLKRIGASCSRGRAPLTSEEWRELLAHWPDEQGPEEYAVGYLRIRR